jgi:serine/threonine-protein kinase RsbT
VSGSIKIFVRGGPDVIVARNAIRRLAESIGMDTLSLYALMTAVAELGSNIVRHAGEGSIETRVVHDDRGAPGIEVVARDTGPGIEDLTLALQDYYSTVGSMGCGLPSVRRLTSEMTIDSKHGHGTVVRAIRWLSDTRQRTLEPPERTSDAAPDAAPGEAPGGTSKR